MPKLFRAAAVLAALLFMVGLTDAEEKKAAPTATGKVKSVDAKENKITLEGKKKKDGTTDPDQAFDVVKDAKVVIDGEAKTLSDVKAGGQANLTLTDDKKSVTTITIAKEKKAAPTATGKVKSVDAKENKITLEGKKKTDPDQAFDVAKDAKVTIDGEVKTLGDVKAGDQVNLTLTDDKKSVMAITIGKKK